MKIKGLSALVFIILIFMIGFNFNCIYAKNYTDENGIINPNAFEPEDMGNNKEFNESVGYILGVIRNFGVVVSVISLMIIGLKTMIGSTEEKSEYKERLPILIIGIVMLFLCTTIPSFIYNVLNS